MHAFPSVLGFLSLYQVHVCLRLVCFKYVFVHLLLVGDGAHWTLAGRLFQSCGPAAAKERSPTVTRRDGQMSRRLEVSECSRPRRLVGRLATYCSQSDKY